MVFLRELLLGETIPTRKRERECESSSVSVSPTQFVSGECERRVEGGSQRSGALARHGTLPRRKFVEDVRASHCARQSPASQEF